MNHIEELAEALHFWYKGGDGRQYHIIITTKDEKMIDDLLDQMNIVVGKNGKFITEKEFDKSIELMQITIKDENDKMKIGILECEKLDIEDGDII